MRELNGVASAGMRFGYYENKFVGGENSKRDGQFYSEVMQHARNASHTTTTITTTMKYKQRVHQSR